MSLIAIRVAPESKVFDFDHDYNCIPASKLAEVWNKGFLVFSDFQVNGAPRQRRSLFCDLVANLVPVEDAKEISGLNELL